MKNKTLKLALFILVILLPLALYVYQFASFYKAYKNYATKIILFSLLGLVVTLVLASLIHELGHAIIGKVLGLSVSKITVLFFTVSFENGIKISFNKPVNFGETVLEPNKQENYSKKIVASALGGIIASLIYLVIGMFIVAFAKSMPVVLIFGITYHLSAYVLLVNLIPFSEENDGFLLFNYYLKGEEERKIIDNALNATAQIMSGVQPKDLDSRFLTEFEVKVGYYSSLIKYYRYLAFLWRDEERSFKELFELSDLDKISYSLYEDVYKELFYSSILLKDDNFVKNNKDVVIGYLEKEQSPIDYRVHATYRIYNGEKDWAKLIIDSGIKNLEKSKKYGNASYEIDLLTRLKESLN